MLACALRHTGALTEAGREAAAWAALQARPPPTVRLARIVKRLQIRFVPLTPSLTADGPYLSAPVWTCPSQGEALELIWK